MRGDSVYVGDSVRIRPDAIFSAEVCEIGVVELATGGLA